MSKTAGEPNDYAPLRLMVAPLKKQASGSESLFAGGKSIDLLARSLERIQPYALALIQLTWTHRSANLEL
ncbi:hypothetical protein PVAP13_9KG494700 [Panicum virgatum]|uniref:Uncharacterized protein n=1 Tax=Panicum virgatum TaxID=38727 RepID=A0A8T0NUH5_PANVG|nr:hypothetical protein PVAP13_9KG494700 [Panicum virgatum]